MLTMGGAVHRSESSLIAWAWARLHLTNGKSCVSTCVSASTYTSRCFARPPAHTVLVRSSGRNYAYSTFAAGLGVNVWKPTTPPQRHLCNPRKECSHIRRVRFHGRIPLRITETAGRRQHPGADTHLRPQVQDAGNNHTYHVRGHSRRSRMYPNRLRRRPIQQMGLRQA